MVNIYLQFSHFLKFGEKSDLSRREGQLRHRKCFRDGNISSNCDISNYLGVKVCFYFCERDNELHG